MKRAIVVLMLGLSLSGCGFSAEHDGAPVRPILLGWDRETSRDLCETGKDWACSINHMRWASPHHVIVQTSFNGGHSDAEIIANEVLVGTPETNVVTIHDYAGYAVEEIAR